MNIVSANIEFKAELIDLESAHATARNLTGTGPEILQQTDVFFPCPHGRLKLRILDDNHGELIFYERADAPGPRRSTYQIARTADPYTLLEILRHVSSVPGPVEKMPRFLLLVRTRSHTNQAK